MPKLLSVGSLALLLVGFACSQRVESEERFARSGRERPVLPSSAAPPALTGARGGAMGGPPGPAAGGGTPAEGAGVSGTIEAPGLDAPPAGAVLFVFVRPTGQSGGPPLAVRRMTPPAFPVDFEIGPGDAMVGGGPFPERVTVEARLDGDGDPLSRSAGDRSAVSEPLQPGATGVVLRLGSGG